MGLLSEAILSALFTVSNLSSENWLSFRCHLTKLNKYADNNVLIFFGMRNFFADSSALLGVATASVLFPSPASALDFSFLFSNSAGDSVEGIIRGLVEGQTVYPQSVQVTSSSIGGLGIYDWDGALSGGFSVVGGQIGVAAWNGSKALPLSSILQFVGTQPITQGFLSVCVDLSCDNPSFIFTGSRPPRPVIYTPLPTSVPGPLPIFGAAAAFGFSRKLRKRIKSSANPFSSSYTN